MEDGGSAILPARSDRRLDRGRRGNTAVLAAIELEGLTKRYGTVHALAGASLRVPRGSVFGFLGPNGAGKTTNLRILTGLARPSSGSAKILGHDVVKAAHTVRASVGYLPVVPGFYPWMTGRELLRFTGRLFGLSGRTLTTRVDALLDLAGRTTVFFSTHILSDVERVCDTVAILHRGKVAAQAGMGELKSRYGMQRIMVEAIPSAKSLAAALAGAPWVASIERPSEERLLLAVSDVETAQVEIPAAAAALRVGIRRLESVEVSLEDVFVDLVGAER